ncbi:endogenous retrovirus group V member 2 Env polyprotein-like [Choloepus didactylus]|uniref:endogenous retrovirus group V member 2 Env polyprotein-like n=1 Tax=Choloepus didactylus TaxID=27675 RepID=UPI0018A078A5|nr:endogenous retrovirus group V member 2 Env polyprotein-like [Choloepus didactylus]XP_037684816.1 endogenous retrovirus group V member 2 Env polyprotein-like [Choloepus didactylus]
MGNYQLSFSLNFASVSLTLALTLALSPFHTNVPSWNNNAIVQLSQTVATGEKLTNCWICHNNPQQSSPRPVGIPLSDVSHWPGTCNTAGDISIPPGIYIIPPQPTPNSLPCVTFNSKNLLYYMDRFSKSEGSLRVSGNTLKPDTLPPLTLSNWTACNSSVPTPSPWSLILSATDRRSFGKVCLPPGFTFLCNSSEGFISLSCLHSVIPTGQCAVGFLSHPSLTIYNSTRFHARPRRALGLILAGAGVLLGLAAPWVGFGIHENTLRNLTITLEKIASETGQALSGLTVSLNSLAAVVMDNRLALDYLLAEEGGVCAVANTSCCTWINTTGQVETNIQEIFKQAKWLHGMNQQPRDIWESIKGFLPNTSWLNSLVSPLIILIIILLLIPVFIRIVSSFVTQRLKATQLVPLSPAALAYQPVKSQAYCTWSSGSPRPPLTKKRECENGVINSFSNQLDLIELPLNPGNDKEETENN